MVRLSCVALLGLCLSSSSAIAQCSSEVQVEHVDKKELQQLQQFVNEGHQPWRLDSQAIAAEKALQLDNTSKERWNVYGVPATLVGESETRATYEIKSRHAGVSYRITVERFDWLLPSAKKWEWMVWTPAEVRITRCN